VPADSVSIRIYSGIARFPCDSMAFLSIVVDARDDRLTLWLCSSDDNGHAMTLRNMTRHCSDMYECIADNDVPPPVSRRIRVLVECEFTDCCTNILPLNAHLLLCTLYPFLRDALSIAPRPSVRTVVRITRNLRAVQLECWLRWLRVT